VGKLEDLKEVEKKVEDLNKCFKNFEEKANMLRTAKVQDNLESILQDLRVSCNELLKLVSELSNTLNNFLNGKHYIKVPQKLEKEEEIEMAKGKQKEEEVAVIIRSSRGIFDWCSPEEFREGLKRYLEDYRDKKNLRNEKGNT
jgi:hypothetical protein